MPVFRPGPRVQYAQKVLRFDDDTLSTAPIDATPPLDVAYAVGGVRWQQTNRAATICRPPVHAYYRQKPLRFDDDTLETAPIDNTPPLDVAYGVGGTWWRQVNGGSHRPYSEAYWQRRSFNSLGPDPVTGVIGVTQDDDVAAVTGTFTDPAYGDGGVRARVQQAAYRRPGSEAYFQRHAPFPPPESYTATIAVTQADDTASITGTFTDPPYGDGGIRARVQMAAYRRPGSEAYYQRHTLNLPQDTTVVGSITTTQDDDVASITGTFLDPAYGDGGIRARQNSSAYRRVASEAYYQRRIFPVSTATVVATVTVTQDDDVAAIAGTFTDPVIPSDGGLRLRIIHAARRPQRASYCQRRPTVDVGTAAPVTGPVIPGTPIAGRNPRPIAGHGPEPVVGRNARPIQGRGPEPISGRGPRVRA